MKWRRGISIRFGFDRWANDECLTVECCSFCVGRCALHNVFSFIRLSSMPSSVLLWPSMSLPHFLSFRSFPVSSTYHRRFDVSLAFVGRNDAIVCRCRLPLLNWPCNRTDFIVFSFVFFRFVHVWVHSLLLVCTAGAKQSFRLGGLRPCSFHSFFFVGWVSNKQ